MSKEEIPKTKLPDDLILYTIKEVAIILGTGMLSLNKLLKSGGGPKFVWIGGVRKCTLAALREYTKVGDSGRGHNMSEEE